MNGGAWLTVDGARVDLIYRDLDEVLRWTAAAGDGRFEIRREVGYVAGIATYILAGELALGRVLAGDLPRPAFPPRKRLTERAGLDAIQDRLARPGPGLDALVSDVRARLGLDEPVWTVRPAD